MTREFYHLMRCVKGSDGEANSVKPDQTDLGLHCLLKPICPRGIRILSHDVIVTHELIM